MARTLAIALALVIAPLPATAVITMEFGTTSLPETSFTAPFFELDNTPLSISGVAQANALFLGQGWGTTGPSPDNEYWEYATGLPGSGTLTLTGQYDLVNPTPPPTTYPLPATVYQNVGSSAPGGALKPRLGGLLNNVFNGVVSFLFMSNINTFSTEILDAGINKDDGLGGSVKFRFFDRSGNLLQTIDWAKAVDGSIVFRSDSVNIAGLQIQHTDPRGLEYQVLKFGIEVPAPAPMVLIFTGLAALGLMRRPCSGRRVRPGRSLFAS